MKKLSVKKLGQLLNGRTVQGVKESSTGASLEILFTDGSSFSFVIDAQPTCELAFFPNSKDGNEAIAEMKG